MFSAELNLLAQTDLTPLLAVSVVILIVVASTVWHFQRSRVLLERWAMRNGFELISSQYRWMWFGPFWWRKSQGQSVYRVEVRDAAGEYRWGYVRVGGWFLGLFSDAADVKWDRPTQPRGFPVIMNDHPHSDDEALR